MTLTKFFDAVRRDPFKGSLSQAQVDGCNAILASCARNKVANKHHVADILAQVYHETGSYMLPIKETVYASHTNKNPSDTTVIARLDRAWAKGQLSWVKTPYWRQGWFGRGPIQLTHRANYEKMGKRLGVDLVKNRDLALDPNIGADIAVVGMAEGMFTGKKLGDYRFPAALNADWKDHPRRIVNGKDGTDKDISKLHRAFLAAIEAAGGVLSETPPLPPPRPVEPAPDVPLPPDRPVTIPEVNDEWELGGPPEKTPERPVETAPQPTPRKEPPMERKTGSGSILVLLVIIALAGLFVYGKFFAGWF